MEVLADGDLRRHNSRHSIPAKDGISADTDAFADWRQSYVPMARKILDGARMTFPLSPEWRGGDGMESSFLTLRLDFFLLTYA